MADPGHRVLCNGHFRARRSVSEWCETSGLHLLRLFALPRIYGLVKQWKRGIFKRPEVAGSRLPHCNI